MSRQRLSGALVASLVCTALGCSGSIDAPATGNGVTSSGSGATNGNGSGGSGATGGSAASGSGATGGSSAATGGSTGTTGGSSGSGGSTTGGSAGTTPDPACQTAAPDTDATVLRRLSALEYQRTVQSLFQLGDPPNVNGIPQDTERLGFRTYAEFQTMSSSNLRAYLDAATELADALLADSPRRTAVIGCQPSAAGCLASFVADFGRLAYRRALEQTEIDAIVSDATANALDADDQIRFAIEVLLSSPSFLFRVEVGNAPEGLSTLTAPEVASRLSFALLGRSPSAELLDEAGTGALDTPEGLSAAATAMLGDADAQSFFASFFRQWLGFGTLRAPATPPAGWSNALMPDMQAETDAVARDYAWGGQRFLDVLTTSTTHLTPALATYYGLPAPDTNGLVAIPAGDVRYGSGLLTHMSLLSAKSDGDLIAIRGNWLRRTFLCEELSPPADLADQIGDLLVGLTRTEIVTTRNSMAECRGCHAAIDPIGVGFAKFDATGRYDDTIDASVFGIQAALPDADDAPFSTIAELSAKLRAMPTVPECLTKRAFLYVNGREPTALDACTVAAASQAFVAGSETFPALLEGLVEAPAFRLRRAPAATP